MIHVPIEHAELLDRIDALKPTWLARAQGEADNDEAAGRHVSTSRIWSEVKPVFVDHQRKKCAFCERRLGSAAIEWDVEHFRPKQRVDLWSSPSGAVRDSGAADQHGYVLLAFEPGNYLVACKPCNSNHKRNFFPVAGTRMLRTTEAEELRREEPYLLNPLDPADTPPETIIGFHGITPRALKQEDVGRLRGIATIEVLGLVRPDLDFPRAKIIMGLWFALELARCGDDFARRCIDAFTGAGSEFANCARCFAEVYGQNRDEAERIFRHAANFVLSHTA